MSDAIFSRYDSVDYLKTEADISAYLEAVREDGDPVLMEQALANIQRARHAMTRAARNATVAQLQTAAAAYIDAFGAKDGVEYMAEDFCRIVADRSYPGGWAGIVQYIMKAAG